MRRLVVCLVLAWSGAAYAQRAGVLEGVVVDSATHGPLAGANVVVRGTGLGAVTNARGEFRIGGVPAGPVEVAASFVGYRTAVAAVALGDGSAGPLRFSLEPSTVPGQPITVTASRSSERRTPAPFSTVDRTAIREEYTVQDIPVLLSDLPSVAFTSESGTGLGYTYLNIRGFDARRVAVLVNGIPQNDPEDHNVYWLDMPDIAASTGEIQLQRGAASAFYGPPAIGGSVNLETKDFARERTLELTAGYGTYNTRKVSASFTSGLFDGKYAIHGRLSKIQSDGYRDRAWVDYSSYFLGAVRYDATMTTQVNFYGGPIADGLAFYGIPKSDVTDRERRRANPVARPEEIENFSQPHLELFHEWRISDRVTLNTTLFGVLGEGFFDYDGSWAPYSYFRITPENGFPVEGDPDTLFLPGALIRAEVENRQFGWLPRVTVRHDGGELVAGAELRFHRSLHRGRIRWAQQLPPGVTPDYRYYEYRGGKEIVSLYVHENYALDPATTLLASLQYAYNRYRLYDELYVGTEFAVPYHFLNPRIGVNHNFDGAWNAYASAAWTSREPRLKNLYDAAEASTPAAWGAVVPQFETSPDGTYDFSRPLVTPESLLDLELGAGWRSEGGEAGINLYWMEFRDEIVKSGQLDRFGQPVTGNAERTRHLGAELSGAVRLPAGFEAAGNLTLSRNRFVRHTSYDAGSPQPLDGNPIAGFPDLLGNARVTWRSGDLTATVAGRYSGKQYTDNFRNEANTVDASFLVNLSAGATLRDFAGDLDLAVLLQVNNLFDRLVALSGEGEQFFVAAERNAFVQVSLRF